MLPLRDAVVFPHMVVPLFAGRDRSIRALEEAMRRDKEILLCTQHKAKTAEPSAEDMYSTGTLGHIVQLLRLPDGTVKVLVEGKQRCRVLRYLPHDHHFVCEVQLLPEPGCSGAEVHALMRSVLSGFESYAKLNKRIPSEILLNVQALEDPSHFADAVIIHLASTKIRDRQKILEIL
ncbi:MAG: LON peptidase substrate-binding domain-containing protein, partial [Polyangiales bacterium]